MILYFDKDGNLNCFIHIPKNVGKYIRNKINSSKTNTVVSNFWGIENNIDKAHIPFMMASEYIKDLNDLDVHFYSFSRNPYDRIISAFLYKYGSRRTPQEFRRFCADKLIKYKFTEIFKKEIIHYYPQYLFLSDKNESRLNATIMVKQIEDFNETDFFLKTYDMYYYYDSKTLEIINEIYSLDFELFNYPKKQLFCGIFLNI